MAAQVARLGEVEGTVVALVGLLAAVDAAVLGQRRRVAKGSMAYVAAIGALAWLAMQLVRPRETMFQVRVRALQDCEPTGRITIKSLG